MNPPFNADSPIPDLEEWQSNGSKRDALHSAKNFSIAGIYLSNFIK